MRWLSRDVLVAVVLLSALRVAAFQASTSKLDKTSKELLTLNPQEEKESYDIYSTVLNIVEPDVNAWTIIQETRGFKLCSEPKPDQDRVYRSMAEDYILKNKRTLILHRKFNLPLYTLAPPEEWTRSTNSKIIAVFSAVGFNSDRTRAAVCLWARSAGTCFILVKMNDAWQIDRDWRGDGCGWAA